LFGVFGTEKLLAQASQIRRRDANARVFHRLRSQCR
jgi:hypothetical protein